MRACTSTTATTGARSRASTCSTTASTATYHACPSPGRAGSTTVDLAECPELARPGRTLLGGEQERWLADGLAQRDARWNVVAQQTLVAPFTWTREGRHWTDGWSGYPGARDRFLDAIVERKARDTVVLSGDVHCNYMCDLKRRVDDPPGAVIATEVCGTSISSAGLAQERVAAVLPLNPHVRYARADERGYVALKAGAARVDVALRVVSDVLDPNAAVRTAARFAIEAGRPGIQAA
jgi:alkaline phosphatase D